MLCSPLPGHGMRETHLVVGYSQSYGSRMAIIEQVGTGWNSGIGGWLLQNRQAQGGIGGLGDGYYRTGRDRVEQWDWGMAIIEQVGTGWNSGIGGQLLQNRQGQGGIVGLGDGYYRTGRDRVEQWDWGWLLQNRQGQGGIVGLGDGYYRTGTCRYRVEQ